MIRRFRSTRSCTLTGRCPAPNLRTFGSEPTVDTGLESEELEVGEGETALPVPAGGEAGVFSDPGAVVGDKAELLVSLEELKRDSRASMFTLAPLEELDDIEHSDGE